MQIRRMADASLALAERRRGRSEGRRRAPRPGASERPSDVRAACHGPAHPARLRRDPRAPARRRADHPADRRAARHRPGDRRARMRCPSADSGSPRRSCSGCSWCLPCSASSRPSAAPARPRQGRGSSRPANPRRARGRPHGRPGNTLARCRPPVCLIVNPAAGGGRAGRLAPAVGDRRCSSHGLAVRRCDTRDLDHARVLAGEAAGRGETIVALSGDGMVGAIADTLRELPGAVLGVLPGGRGNDLARVLGIPEDAGAAAGIDCRRRYTAARSISGLVGRLRRPRARSGVRGHRVGRLRQRSQPHRQRGPVLARWPRVRIRGAEARSSPGARRASRSSSTRRASATVSRPTRSAPPTRRPTAAACAPRRTRCSTMACSR